MQISSPSGPPHPETPPKSGITDPVLMERARDLEAAFLAEMLTYAGLGKMPEGGFDGGIGEEQFGSFLREQQAAQMVRQGGIGLAEQVFHAMTKGEAS